MNTVFTIARLTFREALRRKIVLAALLLGSAFLVLYNLGLHFIAIEFQREAAQHPTPMVFTNQAFNFFMLAGMYVVNFLGIATAALITADSLAGEIQSGTIQAVMTKPIRRSGVVLGKWLGNAILLLLYMLLMAGGVVLTAWIQTGYQTPHWLAGISLIYLNSLVIMTLTLTFSSSFSTLATGGAVFGAFGLAFIGGWIERIGTALNNQTAADLGIFTSLLLPSEALWNKASSLMTTPVANVLFGSPFSFASEPSLLMMIYSGLYLLAALALAVRQFVRRDL